MEKNFIRHTRPKGQKQIKQTIDDISRQIHYWKSIGKHEEDIEYWSKKTVYLEGKLNS